MRLACTRFWYFYYSILIIIDGAFSWWVIEGNLPFSVKVQLWLQAAQVELSWLWHKSSGAIWLILLQLHKTSKGHKPPKPWVSGTSFFPNGLVFFPMQAKARPLLVPPWSICLSLSHPTNQACIPQFAIKPNLWPPFWRIWLLFVVDSPLNPSELQVRLSCKGIICPQKCRWLIASNH